MISQVTHDSANSAALRFCIGAILVIKRVEKIVPIQFVAAGIGFPKPFAVSTARPSWLVSFPKGIAGLVPAIRLETADVWVRPIDRPNRSGDKTFRRRRLAALGHLLQKAKRIERFARSLMRLVVV